MLLLMSTCAGGWGCCARNNHGEVMMAGAESIPAALDPFHAEIVAAVWGLSIARDMGMTQVILESDSLMLKQAVESQVYDMEATAGLINELKNLVLFDFNFCSAVYYPQSCGSCLSSAW